MAEKAPTGLRNLAIVANPIEEGVEVSKLNRRSTRIAVP